MHLIEISRFNMLTHLSRGSSNYFLGWLTEHWKQSWPTFNVIEVTGLLFHDKEKGIQRLDLSHVTCILISHIHFIKDKKKNFNKILRNSLISRTLISLKVLRLFSFLGQVQF